MGDAVRDPVATFFAFLNDSVTPDAAKRLCGLVCLGGVAGGVFGSTTVRALIAQVGPIQWLWVCCGLGLAIAAVAWAAGRIVDRNPLPESVLAAFTVPITVLWIVAARYAGRRFHELEEVPADAVD